MNDRPAKGAVADAWRPPVADPNDPVGILKLRRPRAQHGALDLNQKRPLVDILRAAIDPAEFRVNSLFRVQAANVQAMQGFGRFVGVQKPRFGHLGG